MYNYLKNYDNLKNNYQKLKLYLTLGVSLALRIEFHKLE